MATIQRVTLPELRAPVSHYCHVVRTGDRIWVSGSVGVNPDGSIPEDAVDQFDVAMRNLDAALRAVGRSDPSEVPKGACRACASADGTRIAQVAAAARRNRADFLRLFGIIMPPLSLHQARC